MLKSIRNKVFLYFLTQNFISITYKPQWMCTILTQAMSKKWKINQAVGATRQLLIIQAQTMIVHRLKNQKLLKKIMIL